MRITTDDSHLPAGAVTLANAEQLRDLRPEVQAAIADGRPLVLEFPKWTDGRAYSQAVLLRNRWHHRGEIVAHGDVVADMAPLLRRCGFSAMQMRAGQDRHVAERALGWFDHHHQRDPVVATGFGAEVLS
ncbi:MAG: DUF934 domain-containing protein [Rubrivivax sp.]|nr:DUF934 domain-containing protein [Rubrivivax sp.]